MFRLGTRNWPPVSHDLGQALTLLLSHFTKSLRHSMPHSNVQPHGGGIALDSVRMPAVLARAKAIYAFESEPSSRLSKWRAHIGQFVVFFLVRMTEWRGSANARGRFECRFQKTLT